MPACCPSLPSPSTQAQTLQLSVHRTEELERQVAQLESQLVVARESSRSLMEGQSELEGDMLEGRAGLLHW
jgi:hypothetical protein